MHPPKQTSMNSGATILSSKQSKHTQLELAVDRAVKKRKMVLDYLCVVELPRKETSGPGVRSGGKE